MTTPPSKFSLTPAWPDDLPERCSKCQKTYDIRSSLEIGPGRSGRALKKFAPWMTIVMVVLLFSTNLSFLTLVGNGGAMAFAGAIVFPSLVLSVLGSILPLKARLYCHKCHHTEFHPLPKKQDNRITSVSE